jgi:putative endonuclease
MDYFIYIIYNNSLDKFYIGQTDNLERRVFEHNNGLSGYTSRFKGNWNLLYSEIFDSRAEAMKREKFLKKQKSKVFYRKLCGLFRT